MGKALIQPVIDLVSLVDRNGTNKASTIMDLWSQLANLLSGHLSDMHMQDNGVDAVVLKNGTVTKAKLATDVLLVRMAQGQYTGDGTANRSITTSDANGTFTPTEVEILSVTDNIEFTSRDDGTAIYSWWRTSAGAMATGTVDWQGIVTNGFKTGSNVASLSNKSGQVYSWVARKRG